MQSKRMHVFALAAITLLMTATRADADLKLSPTTPRDGAVRVRALAAGLGKRPVSAFQQGGSGT